MLETAVALVFAHVLADFVLQSDAMVRDKHRPTVLLRHVAVVAAVTFAVETVVPAVVGYAVLGDRARQGFLPVAVAGLLLTLGAAIALARHSEPEA